MDNQIQNIEDFKSRAQSYLQTLTRHEVVTRCQNPAPKLDCKETDEESNSEYD